MTRLMFASCMNHDHDVRGKVWQQALAHKPAWLFLIGDNVYMDWGDLLRQSPNLSVDEFARDLFARYDKQLQQQNFRTLVESIPARCTVPGTTMTSAGTIVSGPALPTECRTNGACPERCFITTSRT